MKVKKINNNNNIDIIKKIKSPSLSECSLSLSSKSKSGSESESIIVKRFPKNLNQKIKEKKKEKEILGSKSMIKNNAKPKKEYENNNINKPENQIESNKIENKNNINVNNNFIEKKEKEKDLEIESEKNKNKKTSKFSNLFQNYENKISNFTKDKEKENIENIKNINKNTKIKENQIIKNENPFFLNQNIYPNLFSKTNTIKRDNLSFTGGKKYEKKEENFERNLNEIIFKETENAEKFYNLIPTDKLENSDFLKNNFKELFIIGCEICFRIYELSHFTGGLAISKYKYGNICDFIEENKCFVIKLEKIKYENRSNGYDNKIKIKYINTYMNYFYI